MFESRVLIIYFVGFRDIKRKFANDQEEKVDQLARLDLFVVVFGVGVSRSKKPIDRINRGRD